LRIGPAAPRCGGFQSWSFCVLGLGPTSRNSLVNLFLPSLASTSVAVSACRLACLAKPRVEHSSEHSQDSPRDLRTDKELIADINAGDSDAFEALYFRYRDWVTTQALRMTNDHALALDVLQETFLYVLRKFPGFQLTARMTTFLYPVVRNLSIAARRKTERAQSSETDLARLEEFPAPAPTAGDAETLARVLAELTEDHREILNLRFVDGLSLAEIAEAVEVPLGTVKSRLHHALRTLREDERTRSWFSD
jgi:RNA polymerase sigma-70 factor (ECF subfamily)